MAHNKSEWNALNEKLAQAEYDREQARERWEHWKNEAKKLQVQLDYMTERAHETACALRNFTTAHDKLKELAGS